MGEAEPRVEFIWPSLLNHRGSEGVLKNIVDDDRLLRNYPDYWQSLLQDVCFVENVSQFTWARLAATTAGMLRSHALRAAGSWVQLGHDDKVLWRHERRCHGRCASAISIPT